MTERADEVLGLFLRQRRKMANLNQDDIARALGVSRPTYVSIEQGKRGVTSNELRLLADLFNCTVAELLDGSADMELPRTKVTEFWELLIEEVRLLPAADRQQVLDYVRFLRTRRQTGAGA